MNKEYIYTYFDFKSHIIDVIFFCVVHMLYIAIVLSVCFEFCFNICFVSTGVFVWISWLNETNKIFDFLVHILSILMLLFDIHCFCVCASLFGFLYLINILLQQCNNVKRFNQNNVIYAMHSSDSECHQLTKFEIRSIESTF